MPNPLVPSSLVVSSPLITSGTIRFKKVHPDAELPVRPEPGANGMDLCAFSITPEGRQVQIILPPRTTRVIRTGLVLMAPTGFFLAVCSRSGMAAAQPPLFVANAPGIIDSNFTGELKVVLFNGGHESAYIRHGQRIAQIIVLPERQFPLTEMAELPETSRGDKGFGSTDAPRKA